MAEWSMNDWEKACGYAPESVGNKLNDDDINHNYGSLRNVDSHQISETGSK
jgi:hypothetical protein